MAKTPKFKPNEKRGCCKKILATYNKVTMEMQIKGKQGNIFFSPIQWIKMLRTANILC